MEKVDLLWELVYNVKIYENISILTEETTMILMPLNMIKEGMINAKPIYISEDSILLDEGDVIRDRYLERITELGIRSIYVKDDSSDKESIHDIIREELRISSSSSMEKIMNNICYVDEEEIEQTRDIITNIIEDLLTTEDILVNLFEMKATDDYAYGHSVNVSILSLITAIKLGYNKEKLVDLGVGAILHDIGKTKVDLSILNKPSSLTMSEYDQIKKHTLIGYEMLNDIKNISYDSKIIALSHHERYDGSGYPHNAKGEGIHEFARIVAVADVYDALTNDRVYRTRISTDEAVDYIASVSGSQFDSNIADNFIENIARYPVGKGVILNTGFKGYVVFNKKNHVSRPIVRILYNNMGERVKIPYIIDLSEVEDSIKVVGTTDDIELF